MASDKLNSKQEAFAQALADGKTQADAYRIAYGQGKMSDKTIHEQASKLAAVPKVSTRIDQLKKVVAERALWTREQSIEALIDALAVAKEGGQSSAMTGAVKELNAMHGFNAPAKIDHTSSDGSMSPPRVIEIVAGKD